jgi:hypothetical protein
MTYPSRTLQAVLANVLDFDGNSPLGNIESIDPSKISFIATV